MNVESGNISSRCGLYATGIVNDYDQILKAFYNKLFYHFEN